MMMYAYAVSPEVASHFIARVLAPTPAVAKAAQRSRGAMKRLFKSAVKDVKALVSVDELTQILSLGNAGTGAPLYYLQPAIQSIADALVGEQSLTQIHRTHYKTLRASPKKLPMILQDTMMAGARAGAKVASLTGMSFATTNKAAVDWAATHSAELVTQITDSVQDAIRLLVVQGFDAELPPRVTASFIKEGIGLTERDAGAVMNRHLQLLSDGASQADASQKAERYAQQLLNRRANVIAEHETLTASREGQRELWSEAEDEGLLESDQQMTLIQVDPCDICAPMADEVVSIHEEFSEGLPPFHVGCQCLEGLV